MSEFQTVENKQLIAQRVPPSLTDTLETYFQKTKFNAAFYLDPLGGALYAVERTEVEIQPEPIKTFDFYGDGYQ